MHMQSCAKGESGFLLETPHLFSPILWNLGQIHLVKQNLDKLSWMIIWFDVTAAY